MPFLEKISPLQSRTNSLKEREFQLFWTFLIGPKNELPSIIIYIWKGFYIGKKAFLNNMGKKLHFTVDNRYKSLHTILGIYQPYFLIILPYHFSSLLATVTKYEIVSRRNEIVSRTGYWFAFQLIISASSRSWKEAEWKWNSEMHGLSDFVRRHYSGKQLTLSNSLLFHE